MKELVAALRERDQARAKELLEAEPKLARKGQAVCAAAGAANLAGLKLLQRHGADWNAINRGYRPLHALIQVEPHAEHGAPSKERLQCLAFLLEHGADPEAVGAWPPARALVVAANTGVDELVDVLCEHGAKLDGFTASALGDVARVKKALEGEAGFAKARDEGGLTALQCCAASRLGIGDSKRRRRFVEVATLLLDAGADPNAKTKSWSHEIDVQYLALGVGDRALVELLFERGADATAALPSALWKKNLLLAELVLARGADIDARHDGRPALNELIRWGQVAPALWMLERGADPNKADERGWTAVHQAASRGNERLLRAVLEKGGDAARKDARGLTPLHVAQLMRKPKMVALMAGDRAR